MGYSCTVKAALVVEAVEKLIRDSFPIEQRATLASNIMPDGGFWERGREQDDGSITGTVFKPGRPFTDAERAYWAAKRNVDPKDIGDPVTRGGSVKVSADGKIVRWPGVPRPVLTMAEKLGAKAFDERYGNVPSVADDWTIKPVQHVGQI